MSNKTSRAELDPREDGDAALLRSRLQGRDPPPSMLVSCTSFSSMSVNHCPIELRSHRWSKPLGWKLIRFLHHPKCAALVRGITPSPPWPAGRREGGQRRRSSLEQAVAALVANEHGEHARRR